MLYFKGLLETYRSGRTELDSKSSCPLTRARGFESHRLRHNFIARVNEKHARAGYALAAAIKHLHTQKNTVWCFFYFLLPESDSYCVEKPSLTFGRKLFGKCTSVFMSLTIFCSLVVIL